MAVLPTLLDTPRLRLRAPKLSNAQHVFARYGQDPEVAHFMIWRPHTELGQTQEFIRDCLKAWDGEDRLPYVLTHQGSDEPVGTLDARLHGHLVDIGYVLAMSEWGGGLIRRRAAGRQAARAP